MSSARELVGAGFSVAQAAGIGGFETSLAATGSVQSDAAPLATSMVLVTGADGTKGVILPLATPGDEVWIFNSSASALKVYPDTGAAVSVSGTGLGVTNAALSVAAQKAVVFKRFTTTQWIAITTA